MKDFDLKFLLSSLIHFIIKNWHILSFSIVLGIIIGLIKYNTTTPYYRSRMVVSPNFYEHHIILEVINHIPSFQKKSNQVNLSQKMDLSLSSIKKIQSIKANHIEFNLSNYQSETKLFSIIVDVYDKTVLDSIQYGLVNYLRNNPYINFEYNAGKKNLKELIASLEKEINDVNKKNEIKAQKVLNLYIDDMQSHVEKIELIKDKQDAEYKLKKIEDIISIISKPQKPDTRYNNFYRTSMKYPIALFFLGIVIAFIRHLFKK